VKKLLIILVSALFGLSVLSACSQETPEATPAKPSEQTIAPTAQSAPMQAAASGRSGTVVETMNAMNYTYLKVDTGSETFWAATSQIPLKVGDAVVIPEGTPMPNFHSKELDRTFDMIYFVGTVLVGGESGAAAPAALPPGHPAMNGGSSKPVKTDIDLSGIEVAEGGVTVADIYAKKDELTGKPVKLRAKVVKYSPQIMQKNWLHIQDGTGAEGSNDLTVTTTAEAQVGDTVLVNGLLASDVDLGYGYQYDVIIQDADVSVE
jgi:hypothetical protein